MGWEKDRQQGEVTMAKRKAKFENKAEGINKRANVRRSKRTVKFVEVNCDPQINATDNGLGEQGAVVENGLGEQGAVSENGLGEQGAVAEIGLGEQGAVAEIGLGEQGAVAEIGLGEQGAVAEIGLGEQDVMVDFTDVEVEASPVEEFDVNQFLNESVQADDVRENFTSALKAIDTDLTKCIAMSEKISSIVNEMESHRDVGINARFADYG